MVARVVWFTGLSGAGKSTIAQRAATMLDERGLSVLVLDGDAVRSSFSSDLGFTPGDIVENDQRFLALCLESMDRYDVILVPKISPLKKQRATVRSALGEAFSEVYVSASLATVSGRDPKGLYREAREGRLPDLIGVAEAVPYEPPGAADLTLDTESCSPEVCANQLVEFLQI